MRLFVTSVLFVIACLSCPVQGLTDKSNGRMFHFRYLIPQNQEYLKTLDHFVLKRDGPPYASSNITNCTDSLVTCSAHGTCYKDGSGCVCDDDYATFECDAGVECCYKRKNQLAAFLLSFFLGYLGVGRFYVGQVGVPIAKLLLNLFPCIILCILGCCLMSSGGEGAKGGIAGTVTCVVFTALFAWWLADVILFGLNKIDDSNGVKLAAW